MDSASRRRWHGRTGRTSAERLHQVKLVLDSGNHTTISEFVGTHIRPTIQDRKTRFHTQMRLSLSGNVASGVLVSGLAGCGHGGYGSMAPAPTVSFSQPAAAASINLGQAVTVAWSSAYTT